MQRKNIEFDLQNKIRQYINSIFDQNTNSLETENYLINKLNSTLKSELLFKANRNFLKSCSIFSKFEQATLKKLTLAMKNIHYYPEDYIFQVRMQFSFLIYFVLEGS